MRLFFTKRSYQNWSSYVYRDIG